MTKFLRVERIGTMVDGVFLATEVNYVNVRYIVRMRESGPFWRARPDEVDGASLGAAMYASPAAGVAMYASPAVPAIFPALDKIKTERNGEAGFVITLADGDGEYSWHCIGEMSALGNLDARVY